MPLDIEAQEIDLAESVALEQIRQRLRRNVVPPLILGRKLLGSSDLTSD